MCKEFATVKVVPGDTACVSIFCRRIIVLALSVFWLVALTPVPSFAQEPQPEDEDLSFSQEQLEQLAAPIALHPDALLSQILMASTYPLEIVQAARWVEENPDLEGEQLEDALEAEPWDPSVKSLAAFPQVLDMLNDELEWTQLLGDAFLGQQEDLLKAIQMLRSKADGEGHLKSTEEQTVVKKTVGAAPPGPGPTLAPSGDSLIARAQSLLDALGYDPGPVDGLMGPSTRNAIIDFERDRGLPETGSATQSVIEEMEAALSEFGGARTVIVIEPAKPEVVYVPVYNPTIVYGAWPYPAYPPYYWYPPGYVASRAFWFTTGVIAGRALWGGCDWWRRSVNIDVNIYNRFNRTRITNTAWRHNPAHRRAVPYRGREVAARHGARVADPRAREQFRGRAEAARRDLPRVDAGRIQRPGAGAARPDISAVRPNLPSAPGARPDRPTTIPSLPSAPAARPSRPSVPPVASLPSRPSAPAARPSRPTAPVARPARPQVQARPAGTPAAFRGIGNGPQVRSHSARGARSRGRRR